MHADDLRENLRDFIAKNFMYTERAVSDDTSLLESGLIDSTGAMELITHIETTLGRTFADSDLVAANLDSIDRILTFVGRTASD
ncbi:MAG TPA: acyl carrier protein [Ilumatobacteraceae bacterium]|nr:acyl carrier protein [Ilumatobacteraceae bacterium]HRB04691.1 acyl carrier protein [Ilumatobacteraceae bacterium]